MQRSGLNVPDRVAEAAALGLLVLAFAFGGGSRGTGDLVVHLTALAVLPMALLRTPHAPLSRPERWLQWWFVAAAAVLALQLLPLPPRVWQHLPLRADLAQGLAAAGQAAAWRPMTLDPWGTVRGLLWLMVGFAGWRLMLTLPLPVRVRWLKAAVLLGVAMALLGFAQAAAGRQPTLRFHPFHNEFGASGTFANRNHFALLMAMLAPLALGLGRLGQAERQPAALAWYAAAVLLVLAAALSFSRAGFLLAAAGTAIAAVWAWRARDVDAARSAQTRRGLILAATASLAVTAVATYAWAQLAARFDREPLDDLRFQYLEHGWSAIKAYLPLGSGAGTFRWAYAPFEPVGDMGGNYALHAHNDLLEVTLELGWPGLALTLWAVAVIAILAFRRWQHPGSGPTLALVTWVAVSVALAHSLVDYPLRTLSAFVLFAGLVAMLRTEKNSGRATANGLA